MKEGFKRKSSLWNTFWKSLGKYRKEWWIKDCQKEREEGKTDSGRQKGLKQRLRIGFDFCFVYYFINMAFKTKIVFASHKPTYFKKYKSLFKTANQFSRTISILNAFQNNYLSSHFPSIYSFLTHSF